MQLFFLTVNVIPQTYFTHNNLNISISIIHSKKHIIDKVNFKTKRFQIQLSNSEPFTNQQFFFTGIEICALHIAIVHQDQLCDFLKTQKK